MQGYLALVLHAHLPFVRHPEHNTFLEENWLFEAITETYVPLLRTMLGWQQEGIRAPVALTLTPTLCAMLSDPLLQQRYRRHLEAQVELTEKEAHRTLWERPFHDLARFYLERFSSTRRFYEAHGGDLLGQFRKLQEAGCLEILTSAATHAILPLLASHPPSLRAQILVARDSYRHHFGCDPRGIWLPECAYSEPVEAPLREANLRWFITDTQGILQASPRPRYGMFSPLLTAAGLAAFGRDVDSAKQVWSRSEGYPGDPRYRDFYRDIGFDLNLDYLKPHLPASDRRSFTGIKYHRITGAGSDKSVYVRSEALRAADEHASHFLTARINQIQKLRDVLERPPLVLSPYDAELFGHWWYEGPEFLDLFVRKTCHDQHIFTLITPGEYLRSHPTHQLARPAPSSWGEDGYWRVWLNERNHWIYPHLRVAQERMTEMVRRFSDSTTPGIAAAATSPASPLLQRALRQAARELLLAQASDWPFILRTGTSPDYAANRVKDHLRRFTRIYEQLAGGHLDGDWLGRVESVDNLFPELDWRYWV
jgi:1,4-alpha-glucan branching enzyme